MSTVRFIADLHLGHNTIHEKAGMWRNNCKDSDEHDEWIINQWNSVVKKQDLTWVLGDVAFKKSHLEKLKKMNGVKHLILGNHDEYSLDLYSKYFNKIHGFMKYKGFWLSHAPILYTRKIWNIHGHTHGAACIDGCSSTKHFCVSIEALNGVPITLDRIKERIELDAQITRDLLKVAENYKKGYE